MGCRENKVAFVAAKTLFANVGKTSAKIKRAAVANDLVVAGRINTPRPGVNSSATAGGTITGPKSFGNRAVCSRKWKARIGEVSLTTMLIV